MNSRLWHGIFLNAINFHIFIQIKFKVPNATVIANDSMVDAAYKTNIQFKLFMLLMLMGNVVGQPVALMTSTSRPQVPGSIPKAALEGL